MKSARLVAGGVVAGTVGGPRRRPRRRGVPVPERYDRRGPGNGGDEHDVRRCLLAERRRRRLPQRRRHAHLLHQRGQGGLGLCPRRPQRDHGQAVQPGRRHLREVRCRPDRLEVREMSLPRVHGRHLHASAAAAGRRGLPRLPRARDPGAGGRHDPRRLPQHLSVPCERASPRRLLRERQRGRPVQRRHQGRRQGRRRRAARRQAHLRLAGARARRARARRRELGHVDVPLAHRRGLRHVRGPDGPDRDHRPRHGAARRQPEGRRPRGSSSSSR